LTGGVVEPDNQGSNSKKRKGKEREINAEGEKSEENRLSTPGREYFFARFYFNLTIIAQRLQPK
jgi:hypothetical protein